MGIWKWVGIVLKKADKLAVHTMFRVTFIEAFLLGYSGTVSAKCGWSLTKLRSKIMDFIDYEGTSKTTDLNWKALMEGMGHIQKHRTNMYPCDISRAIQQLCEAHGDDLVDDMIKD